MQLYDPPILVKTGPLQLYDPPILIKIGLLQLYGPPILIKIGPLQLYDPPSLIKIGPLHLYDVWRCVWSAFVSLSHQLCPSQSPAILIYMTKPDGFAYGLGLIGSQPRSVGASLDIKHASLALNKKSSQNLRKSIKGHSGVLAPSLLILAIALSFPCALWKANVLKQIFAKSSQIDQGSQRRPRAVASLYGSI